MKTKLCIGVFLLAAALARAQTNGLTDLLQQGLFEEQANRNLDAAIADYQNLAGQFDKDRQLAATAVFRLGECYRAQGRTNEAAAQYQRILHEFSDQPTLATLSRQDLAGMGMAGTEAAPAEKPAMEHPDVLLWNRVKDLPKDELERLLPMLQPDNELNTLLQERNEAADKLATLLVDYSATNVVVERVQSLVDQLNREIGDRITGTMEALKMRAELAESYFQPQVPSATSTNPASAPTTDGEDTEIARVQQMIQNSPDLINAPSDGATPLVKAAYNGWFKVAAYLLDHGADVNIPCRGGRGTDQPSVFSHATPLVAAVAAGNKAMAKFLIDRGANLNYAGLNGDTALHLAAKSGFQSVAEVLLAGHAAVNARNDAGATPLFVAAEYGQLNIVQMLLAAGADVNLKGDRGNTALNYAIGVSPEIFQALLVAGANPNTEDDQGRTPLSYATDRGDPEFVKMLLAARADPNAGTLDAPLLGAIRQNDPGSAELLLQAGANPNAKGEVDWEFWINGNDYVGGVVTPLALAMGTGQGPGMQPMPRRNGPAGLRGGGFGGFGGFGGRPAVEMNPLPMVQLLLKYHADPNDTQTDGRALLFSALDKPEIVKALLEAGADPQAKGIPGVSGVRVRFGPPAVPETVLNEAVNRNLAETVELLLQHGAKADAHDERGLTPLHFAADELADERIFTALLDHQANPNVRDNAGQTPLDIVKQALQDHNWAARFDSVAAKDAQAEKLISLLHQHGALDNLPDWDHLRFSRPADNYSAMVFQENTNGWNHFTLLEFIYSIYPNGNNTALNQSASAFPDLAQIVVVRPATDGAASRRMAVNLLAGTNGVDCSRDVPLEFGDVVEIPEREHSLAEGANYLSHEQEMTILNYFRARAGEARLVVAGGSTVQLPLQPFFVKIGDVLHRNPALGALTSNSDLSRVKVTRHDPATNKAEEWTVDMNGPDASGPTALWLRAGDVIEVPEKP